MKKLFLAISWMYGVVLMAQQLPVQTFDSTNSCLTVDFNYSAMAKNKADELFLATGNQVIRFDGTQCTVFDTSNVTNWPDNSIQDIIVDGAGNIWMFSSNLSNAIAWYDGSIWNWPPGTGSFPDAMAVDNDGVVWVADGNSDVNKYDTLNNTWISIDLPLSSNVWDMTFDQDNNLWVSMSGPRISRLDLSDTTWTTWDTTSVSLFDKDWWYSTINVTHNNQVIIAGSAVKSIIYDGTQWLDLDTESDLYMSVIMDIAVHNNESYIAHFNGFGLTKYDGVTWKKMVTDLWSESFRNIVFDSQNNLWLLGFDEVYKIDKMYATGTFEKETLNEKVRVYPNPGSDFFRITGIEKQNIQNARLYDLSGRLVKQYTNRYNEYPVSDLEKGTYILQVKTPEKQMHFSFVKH